jgi:pimeloyl-ACP methyl ester carboxylesterase
MPAFDADTIIATLDAPSKRSYWEEWRLIRCPTLVVRGDRGLPADEAVRMVEALPGSEVVVISAAGHDAHLEQPEAWERVLADFLARFAEH